MSHKGKASASTIAAIVVSIVVFLGIAFLLLKQPQTTSNLSELSTNQDSTSASIDTANQTNPSVSNPSQQADLTSTAGELEHSSLRSRPDSFSESIQDYTEEEQQRLIQFSNDHFGVLEFVNAEQRDWMSRHGYPDAEDILEAEQLSFEELQARADAGDPIAMGLASERALNLMIEEASRILEHQEKTELLYSKEYWNYRHSASGYARALTKVGSPFGAYLNARLEFERALLFQGDQLNDESLRSASLVSLNSLYMAELMGDDRVDAFAREFAQSTGVIYSDLQTIQLAYSTIRAAQTGIDCALLFGNDRIPEP